MASVRKSMIMAYRVDWIYVFQWSESAIETAIPPEAVDELDAVFAVFAVPA